MLLGRRLPLPQPASPGWSFESPWALIAALAHPASVRSFSLTPWRLANPADPTQIFLNLRRQLQAERDAERRAKAILARQNQQGEQNKRSKDKQRSEKTERVVGPDATQSAASPVKPPKELDTSKKAPASLSPANPGITPASQQPQQPNLEQSNSQGQHDTGEPADMTSQNVLLQGEDATTASKQQDSPGQAHIDTQGDDHEKPEPTRRGAKFWTGTAKFAKPKTTSQTEPENDSHPSLFPVVSPSTSTAVHPEEKVEGISPTKDAVSNGAASEEVSPPSSSQQARPPRTGSRRHKHSRRDSQKRSEPPVKNESKPPKAVKLSPKSKNDAAKGGNDSAKSIFDMLFQSEGTEKQKAKSRGSLSLTPGPLSLRPARPALNFVPKSKHATESIFAKLFPENAQPESEGMEAKQPREIPSDTIFVSLRNEVRSWIPPQQQHQVVAPRPGEHGASSTLIILWSLSPSLSETDFYRIIPESKHVEGWAGGLVKVIQARDPLNQQPLGRYYLLFHSQPAANIWISEAERLRKLQRKLIHPLKTGLSPTKGKLDDAPIEPQPFLSKEEEAEMRSFTLCSPSAPYKYRIESFGPHTLHNIAANGEIMDVVNALKTETDTPARVLITVTLPGGGSFEPSKHGLTVNDLWITLRDDGRERNAPWALANLNEGIMPVETRASGPLNMRFWSKPIPGRLRGVDENEVNEDTFELPRGHSSPIESQHEEDQNSRDKNDGGDEEEEEKAVDGEIERHGQFILTFHHRPQAKRFVRAWHKRTIYDAEMDRHVVIDAVPLL